MIRGLQAGCSCDLFCCKCGLWHVMGGGGSQWLDFGGVGWVIKRQQRGIDFICSFLNCLLATACVHGQGWNSPGSLPVSAGASCKAMLRARYIKPVWSPWGPAALQCKEAIAPSATGRSVCPTMALDTCLAARETHVQSWLGTQVVDMHLRTTARPQHGSQPKHLQGTCPGWLGTRWLTC